MWSESRIVASVGAESDMKWLIPQALESIDRKITNIGFNMTEAASE